MTHAALSEVVTVLDSHYSDRSGEQCSSGGSDHPITQGGWKRTALLTPNGGESWWNGVAVNAEWDTQALTGDAVDLYILVGNSTEILSA